MPDPRAKPVLIVDDTPLMADLVRSILDKIGFRDIDEARDGRTALSCLRSRSYGLVISDVNMAPMDGCTLLQHVRAEPALRGTPFVLMTTAEHAYRFADASRAGVSACLVKPFRPAAVRETIAALFGARPPGDVVGSPYMLEAAVRVVR